MQRSRNLVLAGIIVLFLAFFLAFAVQSSAVGHVELVRAFEPDLNEFPEGIAVDKQGNIVVSLGAVMGPFGEIRRIAPDGTETTLATYTAAGASGLAVDAPGNVYYAVASMNDAIRGIYRVSRDGSSNERLPGTEAIILPNGLALDKRGNLYVSDSVAGAIWRIPPGGAAENWAQDITLTGCGLTPGFPPVGANGVAFRKGAIYVASTERGLLVRIPVLPDGSAGVPEVLAGTDDCEELLEDLDSIDGIAFDARGNLFALLVIQHKLVKINPKTGHYTEILGPEDGLWNGASLAFGTGMGERQSIYIANFALIPPPPDEDSFGQAVLKVKTNVPGMPLP